MISRQFKLLLTFFMFLPVSCVGGQTIEKRLPIESGYRLTLPPEIRVNSESPVDDFVLYKFLSTDGKQFLLLYIGNQPFSDAEKLKRANYKQVPISGFPSKIYTWTDQESHFGDIYIELPNSEGWPMYAHFSYKNVNNNQKSMIEKVIRSFSASSSSALHGR